MFFLCSLHAIYCICVPGTIVTYLAVNVIVPLRVHYSLLRKAMVTINACSDVLSF